MEIRNWADREKLITTAYETTPIIKRVYNDKNQQTEEWYLNEKGELREPFAIAKYKYSGTGVKIFVGWFNKNGEQKN